MENLTISPANLLRKSHCNAVVSLLDCYCRDPMGNEAPWDEEKTHDLLTGLTNHPKAFVLLAWLDEKPVGMAVCFEGFSTFRAKPLVNIHDLIVHQDFRRKGVASALFTEIENQAKLRGACRVTLEVRQDNAGAMELYRKQGYGAGSSPMEFWGKFL